MRHQCIQTANGRNTLHTIEVFANEIFNSLGDIKAPLAPLLCGVILYLSIFKRE